MTFFGYTIGDWTEFISIIEVGMSVGSWLFKKIALDPLRSDIQVLHDWGCDIKQYVVLTSITADEYKSITGTGYAP